MFGPTTGDKVRLGDTSLWVEIEKDHTSYGDECKFGGGEYRAQHTQYKTPYTDNLGKVLRDGAGQASGRADSEVLDLVITNALIIDWTGIFKVSY